MLGGNNGYTIASGNRQQATGNRQRDNARHRLTGFFYILVIVIASMTMVKPANASGSVSTSTVYSMTVWGVTCTSDDLAAFAACVTSVENANGQQGSCWVPIPGREFCAFVGSEPGFAYPPTISVCPAHSTGTPTTNPTSCTCNDKYQPDPFHVGCAHVPDVICPIPGLTPLTDQVAIDFDNNVGNRWRPDGLTPAYQEHVSCVEREVRARGGTPVGTSAYRPTQYQRHLYEIVQKDAQLDTENYMPAHPECQALRDEVTGEMGPSPGHALTPGQQVAIPGKSRHESGTAFDLTPVGLTATQRAEVYATCGVTNRAVRNERWHTE